MRLLLASVMVYVLQAFAQIDVDPQTSCTIGENGTVACVTATAAYTATYCDSVVVAFSPSPELGEVNPDLAPTVSIGCPSGTMYDMYEMNIVIEHGRGLVAKHPDSCRVTASICLDVGRCIRSGAQMEYGITWFGYAEPPPSNGQVSHCADAGYIGSFRCR